MSRPECELDRLMTHGQTQFNGGTSTAFKYAGNRHRTLPGERLSPTRVRLLQRESFDHAHVPPTTPRRAQPHKTHLPRFYCPTALPCDYVHWLTTICVASAFSAQVEGHLTSRQPVPGRHRSLTSWRLWTVPRLTGTAVIQCSLTLTPHGRHLCCRTTSSKPHSVLLHRQVTFLILRSFFSSGALEVPSTQAGNGQLRARRAVGCAAPRFQSRPHTLACGHVRAGVSQPHWPFPRPR